MGDLAKPYQAGLNTLFADSKNDTTMIAKAHLDAGKPCWRVFYTMPRSEKKCEAELYKKGIEVFLPKYTEIKQWSDRKKRVTLPLFPNYIFACVHERDRLRVLQTRGIVRCIAFQGRPAMISQDEIEQLELLAHCPELIAPSDPVRPNIGQHIEVSEGPMQGLKGTAVDYRGRMHIIVEIPSIRQAVRIVLPAHHLVAAA